MILINLILLIMKIGLVMLVPLYIWNTANNSNLSWYDLIKRRWVIG